MADEAEHDDKKVITMADNKLKSQNTGTCDSVQAPTRVKQAPMDGRVNASIETLKDYIRTNLIRDPTIYEIRE